MQNNAENIRQIEYVLVMMEHVRKQRRRHRIVSRTEVKEFFMYAFRVYDRIQHRMHIQHLNYTYVCYVICSRYLFESCLHIPNRRFVSPATVNSYFKNGEGDTQLVSIVFFDFLFLCNFAPDIFKRRMHSPY